MGQTGSPSTDSQFHSQFPVQGGCPFTPPSFLFPGDLLNSQLPPPGNLLLWRLGGGLRGGGQPFQGLERPRPQERLSRRRLASRLLAVRTGRGSVTRGRFQLLIRNSSQALGSVLWSCFHGCLGFCRGGVVKPTPPALPPPSFEPRSCCRLYIDVVRVQSLFKSLCPPWRSPASPLLLFPCALPHPPLSG